MSEQSKPCPFCGINSWGYEMEYGEITHYYCEGNCGCRVHPDFFNDRPIEDALQARIAELEAARRWIPVGERLPEAERKEFCPNCEAETPCTHEAELFVCDICGEDFAKYIVSRNCNVSDVSMTRDVLTDIKTPRSIENNNPDYYNPDYYKQELARRDELEAENERLSQLLHDEMSQLEIATDLGNKRWAALNKIYEHGEKHNTNWCKRIAQEGLGIKNA